MLWLGLGGHWRSPTLEYIAQLNNSLELRVTYRSWSILPGKLQCVHAVDNVVVWCERILDEMMVAGFQDFGDLLILGYLVDYLLATIVFQRRANIPTILFTKVSQVAHTGLFVNDEPTAKWSNWCGTIVAGSI